MTVTKEQFEEMVEDMTTDLIRLLMEREGLTMSEAFKRVYTSDLYQTLHNPDSHLYYQSPGYVYSFLATKPTSASHRTKTNSSGKTSAISNPTAALK